MPSAKSKAESKHDRSQHGQADRIATLIALDEMIELVQNKRKLFWLNFVSGFYRGVGGVIGAALVIVLLGYLVTALGGLPVIGNFIRDVQHNLPAK